MGLDDVCNAGLALALGSHDKQVNHDHLQPDHHQEKKKKKRKKEKFSLKYDHLFPSLTLGPSDETSYTYQLATTKKEAGKAVLGGDSVDYLPNKQASSLSAVSSFSNSSSIKRERELSGGEEEVEVERVSSRVSDEDEEASPRKKLRLTKEQSAILEDNFKEHATLNPKQKQDLAHKLNLRPRQVEVWFQNRRARTKLKQTEVDCELLKKCCERLTDENKKLQKELQELKSLKLSAPFYMQLPAATLTMCPSCERICNGGDGSSTSPFSIGPSKPHFFNPFTHPSAAC
ncbi:homeobox-leucine zipper protein HAT22-like [Quercus lobata]|uniref:Homeobox domain-containing protein n=1 Tax=Quercus lobata TaxID=97700 RepID=A0A7N2KR97_QUELO|nr:homeobox-leucine zipper protein HAT22-like [Quercus lobata]